MHQHQLITIVGVGGTGCTVASLLARQGYRLLLIDRDIIERSNLNRQILYTNNEIGREKAIVAKERLSGFTEIEAKVEDVKKESIDFHGANLIIDCTDNMETRMLINDYCKKHRLPWIYTGAIENKGTVFIQIPEGPCLRCFADEKYGEVCESFGVEPAAVAMTGAIAAQLAKEYLNGKGEQKMVRLTMHPLQITLINVHKRTSCPACNGRYEYLEGMKGKRVVRVCSKGKVEFELGKMVDLNEAKERLAKGGELRENSCSVGNDDIVVFSDGRVIVYAASEREARKKYDQMVGI
ncbi:HesA/MoeB/ThiF family protein [Candidatus Woesearchaeota archaeon]|nr:HesA/MoeB/ThiF family protein [Candidatus Woesearchaeota archaeon]